MEYPSIEKFLGCKISKKDIESLKKHCIENLSKGSFMKIAREFNKVSARKEKEVGDYFISFALVLIDAFLRMYPPMLKEHIAEYEHFKEEERDNGAILFNLLIIMFKKLPELNYKFLIH